MEISTFSILTSIIGLAVGGGVTATIFVVSKKRTDKKAEELLSEAKKEADKYKRDSILELKEESYKLKQEAEKEARERRNEQKQNEDRLMQREKNLDKREEMLQNRDNLLNQKDDNLSNMQKEVQKKEAKMDELLKEEIKVLEGVAKVSKKEAHDMILKRVEGEMAKEITSYIKEKEGEAKLEVDKKAKNMLVSSMQRYANDVTTEQTVSVIELPNDEMKGRLIGREGRNIRTIEAVTGVDLIIDDTLEVIVIFSFD